MKKQGNEGVKRIPDRAMKYWYEIREKCKGTSVNGDTFYMSDGAILEMVLKDFCEKMNEERR